jgi:ABC-2 type transport system ATP-binding protein
MTDPAIQLESVTKRYRYFTLDNIDLEVPAGEIMGLIGPNGAGKSTTIRILLGLVHQDSGNVRVLGHRMPAEQVQAKWNIGFASEDMRLYDVMTLGWHMNFIGSLYPKWDECAGRRIGEVGNGGDDRSQCRLQLLLGIDYQ